jgi:hypothetical protein
MHWQAYLLALGTFCSLIAAALFGVFGSVTAFGSGEYTDIKSIALNPSEYFGKKVTLCGQVRAVSAGEAWFVLEDASGKLLIASHQIGLPLYCGSGSTAAIEGQLSDLGAEYGLYFSMTALELCNDQSHPVAATVASLLRRGFAWAFEDHPGKMNR